MDVQDCSTRIAPLITREILGGKRATAQFELNMLKLAHCHALSCHIKTTKSYHSHLGKGSVSASRGQPNCLIWGGCIHFTWFMGRNPAHKLSIDTEKPSHVSIDKMTMFRLNYVLKYSIPNYIYLSTVAIIGLILVYQFFRKIHRIFCIANAI